MRVNVAGFAHPRRRIRMSRSSARPGSNARKAMLGFLARCLAYWGVALALVSRVPAIDDAGVSLTVRTLQLVLGAFRVPVQRVGSALFVGGTNVNIVSDCSPHMPYLIYAGVVLAFPATWRQRAVGLLAGAVFIHLFNTVRILTLIGILAWKRDWFEFAHVYLWQTGTVIAVFVTFALWLRSTARRPNPPSAA
jgi:exosortase/archaeosortase family protein